MPQLARVRIVNFQYNNGKRLIPDELYDFSDAQGNACANTLIALINGGGKSVLVQLMLQPILPEAKVSKRRIADFFTSASCHCFIVLEWLLDNSPMKLITGISMAASNTADLSAGKLADDDSPGKRGHSVRYYTFCANYTNDSAPCAIASLPLSYNANGLFQAAEYEYIRKLKNKGSMGDLRCYSSKDNAEWKKKLEEYGIYQDEWRHLMEPLNSDEGGMSQFFSQPQFKTADRLIDGLFIPAVETRLGQSSQGVDSSLSAMLINYAKQYRQNAENIQNSDRCRKFREDILALQGDVQGIWTLWDNRNKTLGSMFGYCVSLEREVSALDMESEKLEQEIKSTEEKLRHIDWEDVSERYYQCESAARRSEEALERAKQRHEELEARQKADQQRQKALNAARYAQRLRELQSKLDGTLKSIADRTSGDDTAARLGASVRAALNTALPGQRTACQIAETADQTARQALSAASAVLKTAENNERACFGKKETTNAVWTEKCGRTDSLVKSLKIDTMRNLSGLYMTEELEEAREEHQTRLDTVQAELEQIEGEKSEAEAALNRIPGERADLHVQSEKTKEAAEKVQGEIADYRGIEDSIREICRLHSLDFGARFSGSVQEYLTHKRNEQRGEIEAAKREAELTREELSAAESGTVHIPRKVVECLEQSGIPYQTCEHYLLAQIKNRNLTAADCVDILEACPSAAYGILPDEPSLLNEIRPEWLPASIPVFSKEEMTAVLERKAAHSENFSRYSVQSFLDRANYEERLRGKIADLRQQMEQRRDALETTEAHLKTAEAFQAYDADWLARKEEQSQKLLEEYGDFQTRIETLNVEEKTLRIRRTKLERARKEREQEKQKLEKWLERFTELREGLEREQMAYQSRLEAIQNHKESKEKLDSARKDWEQARQEAEKQTKELEAERTKLQEMETAAREVADYVAQATEEGKMTDEEDWFDLYQQYKTLIANRNADIRRMQAEADSFQKDIAETEAELSRIGLDESEYQGVSYSREELDSLTRQIEERDGQLKEAQKAHFTQNGEWATAKEKLNNARKALEQYGGQPVEADQIGRDRGKRQKECVDKKAALQKGQEELLNRVQAYKRQIDRVRDKLEEMRAPETISQIPLEADYTRQWENLREKFRSQSASISQEEKTLQDKLRALSDKFAGSVQGDFLKHAMDLLKNSPQGDVYFTLDGQIDDCIHATELNISQLETDLKDFQHMKRELIHQCCVQGEQIYHELMDMMKSTRIRLGGTGRLTEMIRFGLPNETNPQRAEEEITAELEEGTRKLLERMGDKSVSDTEVRKLAERIVSSGVLLRKYVQREQISLKAYKVDAVEGNGEYRTWEQTLINNSGAEKFLVYFSIILALMNYARGGDSLGIGQSAGVLILDNPFGVITSPHVLGPMFRIARKFRVQLICLSDITKCDITACFDTVIRAVVRENPLSSVSLLTHEGNERIEHGFYRSVQLSF